MRNYTELRLNPIKIDEKYGYVQSRNQFRMAIAVFLTLFQMHN